jgi:hypothetical protein
MFCRALFKVLCFMLLVSRESCLQNFLTWQLWEQYNSHATITFPMTSKFTGQKGDDLYRLCGANIITDVSQPCTIAINSLPSSEFWVGDFFCFLIDSACSDAQGAQLGERCRPESGERKTSDHWHLRLSRRRAARTCEFSV